MPALAIKDPDTDVRGWTVSGRDGRPLGHVSDLLADTDSLTAEYVIVTLDGHESSATQAETVLPVAALRAIPERRQLVSERGMTAIPLRYVSTTYLVWWTAGLLVLIAAFLLVLGVWRP